MQPEKPLVFDTKGTAQLLDHQLAVGVDKHASCLQPPCLLTPSNECEILCLITGSAPKRARKCTDHDVGFGIPNHAANMYVMSNRASVYRNNNVQG